MMESASSVTNKQEKTISSPFDKKGVSKPYQHDKWRRNGYRVQANNLNLNNDLNTKSKSEHPLRETEGQGSNARRRRILTASNIPYNSFYCALKACILPGGTEKYLMGNEKGAKRGFLSAKNVSPRDTSVLTPSRSVDRVPCR